MMTWDAGGDSVKASPLFFTLIKAYITRFFPILLRSNDL